MNKQILDLEMSHWNVSNQPVRFRNYGANLGIEWNKVEDSHLRLNDVKNPEGFNFIVAQNDVQWEQLRGRSNNWTRTIKINKGDVLLVLKDGKPLRYADKWKYHRGSHRMHVKYGGRATASAQATRHGSGYPTHTFGKNIKGMQSISAIQTAVQERGLEIKHLHLCLADTMPYMTGLDKISKRRDYKHNNVKWMTEKEISNQFWTRIQEDYQQRLNNPVVIKRKFVSARKTCVDVITNGSYDEQIRFSGMLKNLIESYQKYVKERKARKESTRRTGTGRYSWDYTNQRAKDFQRHYLDVVQDRPMWNWSRSGTDSA